MAGNRPLANRIFSGQVRIWLFLYSHALHTSKNASDHAVQTMNRGHLLTALLDGMAKGHASENLKCGTSPASAWCHYRSCDANSYRLITPWQPSSACNSLFHNTQGQQHARWAWIADLRMAQMPLRGAGRLSGKSKRENSPGESGTAKIMLWDFHWRRSCMPSSLHPPHAACNVADWHMQVTDQDMWQTCMGGHSRSKTASCRKATK